MTGFPAVADGCMLIGGGGNRVRHDREGSKTPIRREGYKEVHAPLEYSNSIGVGCRRGS